MVMIKVVTEEEEGVEDVEETSKKKAKVKRSNILINQRSLLFIFIDE